MGFEIDLRVFSYTASQDENRVESLKSIIGIEDISKDQIQSQIMGLLWPRGSTSRSTGLKTYNPFIDLSSTERLLFDFLTDEKESVVKYESDDDRREIDEHLKKTGTCLVQCKDNNEATRLFTNLLLTPTEYEVIHIYPRITGVKRNKNNWEISLEIREELQ